MPKLSTIKQSEVKHVCLFGGPKSGKSLIAGQLAEHFNLLWFDFEKGYDVLYQLPQDWQERITIIHIPDSRVFPIGIETALKIIKGDKVSICSEHGKVDCPLCSSLKDKIRTWTRPHETVELNSLDRDTIVVFDSGTQLANSCMAHLTKGKPDEYKPDWDDYRSQGAMMDKFLSQAQVAPFNLIFITHEAEVEFDDGSKKLVPIAGTLNFSRNTAKYFGDVIYCQVKNKKHNFGSSSTYANSVLTGSRTNLKIEDMAVASLISVFKPDTRGIQQAANGEAGKTAAENLRKVVGEGNVYQKSTVTSDANQNTKSN